MTLPLPTVALIPSEPSAFGAQWAQGRLASFSLLYDHLAAATTAERTDEGEIRFHLDRNKIDAKIVRQTKKTDRLAHSTRPRNLLSPAESQFFDVVDSVVYRLAQTLLNGSTALRPQSPETPPFDDVYGAWAILKGHEIFFSAQSPLPPFFGLSSLDALRTSAQAHLKLRIARPDAFSPAPVDDVLGAGVPTALRVYLGQEKLGMNRMELIPHRLTQLDVSELCPQPADSPYRLLLVGSLRWVSMRQPG